MPEIINTDEMEWDSQEVSERFGAESKRFAASADPCGLGASIFRLQPGKSARPFHMHYANDESIWILSGEATLRYGDEKIALKKGDYIALPKGTGKAHQMVNTSNAPVEYLCTSTMIAPEVCIYPDSDKIGVYDHKPGQTMQDCKLMEIHKRNNADYWDDEL